MPDRLDSLTPAVGARTPTAVDIEPAPAVETPTGCSGVGVSGVRGHAPSAGGVVPGESARGAGVLGVLSLQPTRAVDLYAFDSTKAPGSVGFPDVLRALCQSPQGEQNIRKLLGYLKATFGVTVPADKAKAIAQDPERLLQYLRMTPTEMRTALGALHDSGMANQLGMKPRTFSVPETSFSWSKLDALHVRGPQDEATEVAPGLYRLSRYHQLPDRVVKNNIVMAEVFDRLADNSNKPAAERFTFRYQGKNGEHEITRLPELLKALRADGWVVKAKTAQMVADFAHLAVKGPDGQFKNVAAPVMVETPFEGVDGTPVVLPAVHAELIVSIERGPSVAANAPDLTSAVKWYQGVPTTGFMPANLYQRPDWNGFEVKDEFEGDEAAKVVEYAGLYSDLVNDVAKELQLAMSGYGATGVCIDTIAILQVLMGRPITAYPMLHTDKILIQEALRRIRSTGSRLDRPEHRAIIDALDKAVSDADQPPLVQWGPERVADAMRRVSASSTWDRGQESLTFIGRCLQMVRSGKARLRTSARFSRM